MQSLTPPCCVVLATVAALYNYLGPSGAETDWTHLVEQTGVVCFTIGKFFLTQRGCTRLPQPGRLHLTIRSGQDSHLAKAHCLPKSHAFGLFPESPPQQDMVDYRDGRGSSRRPHTKPGKESTLSKSLSVFVLLFTQNEPGTTQMVEALFLPAVWWIDDFGRWV